MQTTTPREEALAHLFCDIYRTDLEGARWQCRLIQPSIVELVPSPRGVAPIRWARQLACALDREVIAPESRLWALLIERFPYRRADIERVRDLT